MDYVIIKQYLANLMNNLAKYLFKFRINVCSICNETFTTYKLINYT